MYGTARANVNRLGKFVGTLKLSLANFLSGRRGSLLLAKVQGGGESVGQLHAVIHHLSHCVTGREASADLIETGGEGGERNRDGPLPAQNLGAQQKQQDQCAQGGAGRIGPL